MITGFVGLMTGTDCRILRMGKILRLLHPRICGEHHREQVEFRDHHGSSPRMRGTRRRHCAHTMTTRFIPAHAGNTPVRNVNRGDKAVHPRACGEHVVGGGLRGGIGGSSPRMRGTPRLHARRRTGRRFIPAHAGNTNLVKGALRLTPVHPRACGEHKNDRRHPFPAVGSSPRMRGTRLMNEAFMDRLRFIPAHAGNTSRSHRSY